MKLESLGVVRKASSEALRATILATTLASFDCSDSCFASCLASCTGASLMLSPALRRGPLFSPALPTDLQCPFHCTPTRRETATNAATGVEPVPGWRRGHARAGRHAQAARPATERAVQAASAPGREPAASQAAVRVVRARAARGDDALHGDDRRLPGGFSGGPWPFPHAQGGARAGELLFHEASARP